MDGGGDIWHDSKTTSILLKETRVSVCLCAKFDQFLPVRSHFDTKHPVKIFT